LAIKKIVLKFVDELQTSLVAKGIRLALSEPVIDLLAEKGYDNKMGARPLGRKIDELIRIPLSKRILFEGLENCSMQAIVDGDEIKFVLADSVQATVDHEGIIQIGN
jgi:ATP-dependent Clp protease ATP-binding subunit ClpA